MPTDDAPSSGALPAADPTEDDRALLHELEPEAARLYDRRFRSAGLSIPEAQALVPEVLVFASEPRTNAEVDAWLDVRLGDHLSRLQHRRARNARLR